MLESMAQPKQPHVKDSSAIIYYIIISAIILYYNLGEHGAAEAAPREGQLAIISYHIYHIGYICREYERDREQGGGG